MDEAKVEEILMENKFPYIDMTKEQRDLCLKILGLCKDIVDSVYKVGGTGKCDIVSVYFKKELDHYHANGCVAIEGNGSRENRWIDADIYIDPEKVIVDMLVERIRVEENKTYRTLDVFRKYDDELKRESIYAHSSQSFIDVVTDEKVKGLIK